MSTYRIDLASPTVVIPCSLVPSVKAPGKSICVNEDGSALGVDPTGHEIPPVPPGDSFDSEYTVADVLSGMLVYRSANGVPRAYKLVQ
jgi:hypothetical protein